MAGGPVACGAPATLSGTRTFPRSFISILSSSCMTGGVVALIHRWVWARQRFPQIRPPRPVHTAVSVPQSGEGGDAPARPSPDRARVCTDARSLLRARFPATTAVRPRSPSPIIRARPWVPRGSRTDSRPARPPAQRTGRARRIPRRRRPQKGDAAPASLRNEGPAPLPSGRSVSRCAVVDEPEIPPSRPLRSNSVDLRLRRPGPRRVLPRS